MNYFNHSNNLDNSSKELARKSKEGMEMKGLPLQVNRFSIMNKRSPKRKQIAEAALSRNFYAPS